MGRKLRNVDCIVFDLDGTLIDSAKGIERCVREVLCGRGYGKFDVEFLRKSIGIHPIDTIFARTVKNEEVRECVREFKRMYGRTITQDAVLLKGAKETIETLRKRGYKVAIYTLKMKNHAMRVLDHFALKVDGILAGDDIGEEKASGNGLHDLVSRLGSKPEKSIIVGDQWSDIAAGKTLGMMTVGILDGMGTFDDLKRMEPDYLAGKVSDLIAILDGIYA